mgnify:CR=1 FL=1
MILKRKEALSCARRFLTGISWSSPQLINGYSSDDIRYSVKWYGNGVDYFTDLMNQKLKDFNRSIEELERGEDDDEEND